MSRIRTPMITAVAVGVLGGCSGSDADSGGAKRPTPAATDTAATAPAASVADPFAHLPRLRLAGPPGPRTFVAETHSRIGLFRAGDGTLIRYVTRPADSQPGGPGLAEDVVGGGSSARV